jgi:hypothetical protein
LGGNGGCFAEETMVVIDFDGASVPISWLRKGDYVIAWEGEQFVLAQVAAAWHMDGKALFKAIFANGSEVYATLLQPFLTDTWTWTNLIDLQPGDRVMLWDEVTNSLQATTLIDVDGTEERVERVYDIDVEYPIESFVVEGGIVAHNKKPPQIPA